MKYINFELSFLKEAKITIIVDKGISMNTSNFKISHFIKQESLGGILLILSTIAALIWANSSESYHHFWHELYIGISAGDLSMNHSIGHWIND